MPFWNALAFSMIQQILTIWSQLPLPFLNPVWISGTSQFTYCWSLAWRILSIIFASMWNEHNYMVLWTIFGIAFLWDWNENQHFPVLRPLLNFPNLLAYWVQYFYNLTFRILNSLAGIPSPPLAWVTVMLPKAYLTLHFRRSGSRWVVTPLWLSGSIRSFLYSSSVYSCHLFLISSASS